MNRNQFQAPQNPQGNRNAMKNNQLSSNKNNSSNNGLGYFLTAAVGLAAGFLAKAFLFDGDKSSNNQKQPQNVMNQANVQRKPTETTDPAIEAQLEDCNDIVCPITLEIMKEPVLSRRCGHSFEAEAITSWVKSRDYCPQCHAPLQSSDLVKNISLKNTIDYMRSSAKSKESKIAQ